MSQDHNRIWIAGYGSLMSFYGIFQDSKLSIFDAFIAHFEGNKGFNTGSISKKKFRMDVELGFNPKGNRVDTKIQPNNSGFECLMFQISTNEFEVISAREGYPNTYRALIEYFPNEKNFPRFLWQLYKSVENNDKKEQNKTFRGILKEKLDLNSLGTYYPHPIYVDNKYGLISIYNDIGLKNDKTHKRQNMQKMKIENAFRKLGGNEYNPNPNEIRDYFHKCILGGVHGINIRDLFEDSDSEENLKIRKILSTNLPELDKERDDFINIIKKNNKYFNYIESFGNFNKNLERSGLKKFQKTR